MTKEEFKEQSKNLKQLEQLDALLEYWMLRMTREEYVLSEDAGERMRDTHSVRRHVRYQINFLRRTQEFHVNGLKREQPSE